MAMFAMVATSSHTHVMLSHVQWVPPPGGNNIEVNRYAQASSFDGNTGIDSHLFLWSAFPHQYPMGHLASCCDVTQRPGLITRSTMSHVTGQPAMPLLSQPHVATLMLNDHPCFSCVQVM